MITSLTLKDFKNFVHEPLRMGPFTVVAGANASGKSNIRDALRFLHGIGRGYTLAEILGGRYGPGGEVQWEGIRGAPNEVARSGQDRFDIGVKMNGMFGSRHYEIGIEADGKENVGIFRTQKERLVEISTGQDSIIYDSHPPYPDPVSYQEDDTHLLLRMGKGGSQKKYGDRIAVRPDQPALTQLTEHTKILRAHKERAKSVINVLGNMRFLDPSPTRLRRPSFSGQTILGDRGDNLPTVLKETCNDEKSRKALIEWTRELTPMDVKDFDFVEDKVTGRIQLVFVEANGRRISAYSASDGTLRFLAILAALMGKKPAAFYFFEEVDTGIHPSRLRLLLELIESQTADGKTQVLTTTHSPELLTMIGDEAFKNTAVVCRQPETEDAVVRQIADLPNAEKLRADPGLGRLHRSGWLEDAVFLDDRNDQKEDGG